MEAPSEIDEVSQDSWLSPLVRYEGWGVAEFRDPHAFVEGPAYIEFDEKGNSEGQLKVEKWSSDEELPMGLFQIFQSDRPVAGNNPGEISLAFGIDSTVNDCISFVIQSESGVFKTIGQMGYSQTFSFSHDSPSTVSLKLAPYRGIYKSGNSDPAYWALPLTNFVSHFHTSPLPTLREHPLRLYQVPDLPSESSDPGEIREIISARNKNKLLVFQYRGGACFIEPVPDYQDRESQLLEGRDRQLVTAIMVGSLPTDIQNEKQVESHLPPDLLCILSLATGTEIGSQWIELRNASGSLVTRIHSPHKNIRFAKGHIAIDGLANDGIENLLSQGTQSEIFDSARLRVTTRHIVRGGLYSQTIEDSLSHFIRALDGLCKFESLGGGKELNTILNDQEWREFKKIVGAAVKSMNALSNKTAQEEGRKEATKAIRRSIEKVSNAKKLEQGFGSDLTSLTKKYELHDLEVVQGYLRANPRQDNRDWLALVSYIRGLVFHNGYIDFDLNPDALDVALAVHDHLHDLLLRIMLKQLGYQGTYQPTVIKVACTYELDWVKPGSDPSHLGYE